VHFIGLFCININWVALIVVNMYLEGTGSQLYFKIKNSI